ncbi:metallophosphoesterase [Hymenobacter sp. B1770]|uniref:metallophosphoesterase family protein n=1 Tax=Hymenobacter sp. B1770 TaxID=1718788 RepID=UPI003CFBB833
MQILSLVRAVVLVSMVAGLFISQAALAQRFAAIGDYGHASSSEQLVAELVKGWKPDFVITLGDNNYEQGAASTIDVNIGQYYHEFIGAYRGRYGSGAATNRFFPSLGNHDTYSHHGQPYLDYFSLPGNERYYDYVRGDVHFFVLNSDPSERDGTSSTSRQAQWLKAQMAASQSRWKIVYFHHPPYSSGSHGSSLGMRWPFREWGASLVLAGHDHHYERLVVDGLPYFVNGLGGRSIYGTTTLVPGSLVRYNADYGAQLLEASADSLRLRFITHTGKLIDSFTLHHGLSAEPQLLAVLPTPFRETAQLEFSLPTNEDATIRLLNAAGREVAVLHKGPLRAGRHQLQWSRGGLAPGAYFVQLLSGHYKPVMRTVVL